MSEQQVKLLQEYISCLERENLTKNKERETLYMEMEQLHNALKAVQQELMRVKMTQSVVCSQQQAGPLKQRINELQSQVEVLKFEQKHLFEENLSLISALEGTANQNTELQQQNSSLKLQKEELEKFRMAIERINASLQELEAERIQLTEANIILVEQNSYLKGILAASRSSYTMFQEPPNSPQHSSSHKFAQKNFHPQNPTMTKSSYLMSSSFQKISENQQEQEAISTQGGESAKRKQMFIGGSTGRKKIPETLMEGERQVDYNNEGDDFIIEQSDANINNFDDENGICNNNEDSSYLMVMDSKEESLRVSWDVQKENLESDKNAVEKEGLKISNFEKVFQKQNQQCQELEKEMIAELRVNGQQEKHSPQANKHSDESSCEVIQQQPLSQASHYHQKATNNSNPNPNHQTSPFTSQPTQQQFQNQQQFDQQRVQHLLLINSELEQELSQLREQLMEASAERDNLYEQLYKREEQERENAKEWEGKVNEMNGNYNAVVEHAERLEDENAMYKSRVSELQQIIKSYNRKHTNLNSSQRQRLNNMISSSSRQNRFSRQFCDNKSRFMMSVGREQNNRGLSVMSVEEPRQVDTPMNEFMQKSKNLSRQHVPGSYQSDYNKENDVRNTNYFQSSLSKDCRKINHRSNQKIFDQSLTEYDHCYQDDQQNSEIKQVENRLQRRILRIKSQNQILLKQLQLF